MNTVNDRGLPWDEWLAHNVIEWKEGQHWLVYYNGDYYFAKESNVPTKLSREQWYQIRSDLGLIPQCGAKDCTEDEAHCKRHATLKENKYVRTIIGLDGTETTVDVYRVLDAWGVINPQLQHLIKKALQTGQRGHKSFDEDLADIKSSVENAIVHRKQIEDASNAK